MRWPCNCRRPASEAMAVPQMPMRWMWRGSLKISPPLLQMFLDFVHKPVYLPNERRKCPEKQVGGRNSQSGALGHGRSEMLRVVAQQPIGFRYDGRDQYGDISFMANKAPVGTHEVDIRVQNQFWVCEIDQAMKFVDQLIGFYDA